ncbi:MAG TPA: Ig-like domain repeat protein, partial [Acidobacteriaceae bacterium]|nr:Ig-like domain repeat protein [Acidobacteriaceae bacterium]
VAAGDAQPAVDLLLNGANGTGTGATLVSIAVTPPNPSILVGATEQFAATGTYSDNSTQDLTDSVTWSSSTMSVATISATGLATGAGAGPTTIGATYNGISGQTTLAVYPAIVIEPASLPGGTAGVAYSQALTATGGSGAGYTWSITAGASSLSGLGLSLSGNTILGSDPTAGTANFTVQVTDSLNFTATMSYTLTIGAALSPANVSDEETISVSDSEVVNTFTLPAPIAVDAPVAYFSTGTPLGFGGQSGNQQTIAVSNIGEASMTLASVALSSGAPFSLSAPTCFNGASSSSTPVTLPSSAFCTVTITYSGSAPTTDTGTLTFTDNAALSNLTSTASGSNYTQSITLNGEGGVTPPPAAPPATEPVTDDETITVTDEVSVIAGYTIGGTLSGLASGGSVMLLDNGGDALTLSKNGAFAFATPLASAAGYDVTVGTQPAGQVCTVSKGTGAVASANITSVSVSCITTTATLSLTAQPASATVNGSVTLTATVTPTAAGPNTPSGIVDFMLRGVSLQNCSAVHVNTSGIATCTTNALPAGEDTITASYADDPNFTVNTPGMVTVNVAAAPATMTLNASPAISALGGSVTLTALVTPGVTGPVTPSGNVNFTLNGASLTGCSSIAVNSASDTAMCTTTTLPAGSDTITATYSSDPNFTVSAPASTTVQVGPANTTTTLTTSGTLGAEGYNLTLTATVTSAAAGTITGVVTFYNGTAELGSMQLQHGSPTVAFSTDTLPEGSNTLTAVYSGDNDFLGSTSAAVDQTISGFNLSFSSNGSITLLPGQTITLTVTVTPVYGAYANPIAFSITGLPSGATYTFSPGSAMPGSNAVTTTLTITIPPASSQSQAPVTFRDAGPALLAILMPAAAFYRKRRRLRSILLALTAVCALGTLSTLSGCGTSGFFNQPPKTYTITVTGSSGAAQHSTTLTVTVE